MKTYESPVTGDKLVWDLFLSQHYLPAVTAAGEVGLWEKLGDRALSIDELAAELGVIATPLSVVLSLLAPLGFIEVREGRWRLTDSAHTYLDPASSFYWGPLLFGMSAGNPIHTRLVEMMRDPDGVTAKSMEGGAAQAWESGQMEIDQARDVATFMHAHSIAPAIGFARSSVLDGVTKLMDVGAGSGVFAVAAAQRHPALQATILELPAMCIAAQHYIDEAGVADRVKTEAVDMWRQQWPDGHDALFFSNIFHDWNREQNIDLAKKSFAVLPSGGKIILHEQLLNDTLDGPLTTASFSVLMLRGTWGRQYSLIQLREILEAAGFTDVEARHSCGYYSLVTAIKP